MSGDLPRAVTADQAFYAAMIAELRGLRADLAATLQPVDPEEDNLVELREPATEEDPPVAKKERLIKRQRPSRRS